MMSAPACTLRELRPAEPLPWVLLLLADPDEAAVRQYLPRSTVLLADADPGIVVGVCVVEWQAATEAEIRNLAVAPAQQGQGRGRALLAYAEEFARQRGVQRLRVCTGNSSLGPFALYQKAGFDLQVLRRHYFSQRYPAPIWENDILCQHLLVLEKNLAPPTLLLPPDPTSHDQPPAPPRPH